MYAGVTQKLRDRLLFSTFHKSLVLEITIVGKCFNRNDITIDLSMSLLMLRYEFFFLLEFQYRNPFICLKPSPLSQPMQYLLTEVLFADEWGYIIQTRGSGGEVLRHHLQ